MPHRAEPSGIVLNEDHAAIIKGMLHRGDRQHDIAAWFGVNAGRVAEIAVGRRFSYVEAVFEGLPPRGPYPSGKQAAAVRAELEEALSSLNQMAQRLRRISTQI